MDIDRVYNQLKKHHPNLYQYTSKTDLDFKFDSLKRAINSPINSRDFYKKLVTSSSAGKARARIFRVGIYRVYKKRA
ncbi:hypothetical protein [Algibacter lectus]|uniref:hypothetical protein n=1 Tax=Algibacter lectus TaxID=221126 RepID=UPI001D106D28|nr:hypothetical protein [Algibacter lectus]